MDIENIVWELRGAIECLRDSACNARANSVEAMIAGIQADYAELKSLRAEREQLLAQQVDLGNGAVDSFKKFAATFDHDSDAWLDMDAKVTFTSGYNRGFLAGRVSVQPSPAVAAPDDRLRQMAGLMAESYKRHAQLRKEARDRGDVVGDKAANHSESCMKMALHLFENTQHIHGFGSPDLALAAVPVASSQSPRITEQDAREILESFRKWDNNEYLGAAHENWLLDSGRALLNKLNAKPDIVPEVAKPDWKPIETAPRDGKKVLLSMNNISGLRRVIVGGYVEKYSCEDDSGDIDESNLDEKDGTYYWKEGWYEQMESNDDYSCIYANQNSITHWMPLPPSPKPESVGG